MTDSAGRIGINARRLTMRRTGVGRYVEYLFREWNADPLPFSEVEVFTERPIRDDEAKLAPNMRNVVVRPAHPGLLWENVALRGASRGLDLFFSPAYTLPLGMRRPTVVTIHDVGQVRFRRAFPGWTYWRYAPFLSASARQATRIIAVSEALKNDIVTVLGIPPSKIDVIYYGIDPVFSPERNEEESIAIRRELDLGTGPLLLFVGLSSKFRQTPELLEAFAVLKHNYQIPHRLVLVGPEMYGLRILDYVENLKLQGHVRHIDYADHPTLAKIYRAVDLLIYPSLSAGFPMPVMEAAASGTPAIVANIPAITEFARGVEAVFSSTDPSIMAREIQELLHDSGRRKFIRAKGLQKAAGFTWRRTAEETRDVLVATARRTKRG